MKALELKRRLAEILEVPVDPVKWGEELLLKTGPRSSKLILAIAVRVFTLECIWEEFEEVLEQEGKSLGEDIGSEEIETLFNLTEQFFFGITIDKDEGLLTEDIQEERNRMIEAISVVKSSL